MTKWATISVRKETRDRLRKLCNKEEKEYDELMRNLIEDHQRGFIERLLLR